MTDRAAPCRGADSGGLPEAAVVLRALTGSRELLAAARCSEAFEARTGRVVPFALRGPPPVSIRRRQWSSTVRRPSDASRQTAALIAEAAAALDPATELEAITVMVRLFATLPTSTQNKVVTALGRHLRTDLLREALDL